MRKIKLFVCLAICVSLIFGSAVVNTNAGEYTAYSGETSSGTEPINSQSPTPETCYLFGCVSVVGTAATWSAQLTGTYNYLCYSAWTSFGKNGSTTDIMSVKNFVNQNCYYYTESSHIWQIVTQGTTCTGH